MDCLTVHEPNIVLYFHISFMPINFQSFTVKIGWLYFYEQINLIIKVELNEFFHYSLFIFKVKNKSVISARYIYFLII